MNPKNITALPKNIGPDQLRETMDSYTNGLGVRCNFCRIGEDGKPLSEFDFTSDRVPMKNITREMIRLTNSVNAQIIVRQLHVRFSRTGADGYRTSMRAREKSD